MTTPWKMPAGVPKHPLPDAAKLKTKTMASVRVREATAGMNGTEARRATELDAMLKAGLIAAWWWESFTFRLADRTTYTPDFLIQENDGSLRVEETKGGFWRDDARAKTKIFAALYPFPTRVLQEKKRGAPWQIEDIPA